MTIENKQTVAEHEDHDECLVCGHLCYGTNAESNCMGMGCCLGDGSGGACKWSGVVGNDILNLIQNREPEFFDQIMTGKNKDGTPTNMKPSEWDDGWSTLAFVLLLLKNSG